MATIGRSFDQLDEKIKRVNKDIKEAKTEVRGLDKALKLDPTNITLIAQKYEKLEKELEDTTKKSNLLKQKQTALQQAFKSGEITLTQYQRLLDKASDESKKLDARVEELTVDIAKQNQVIAKARYDNIINGAQKASQKLQPLANAMKAVVAVGAVAFKFAVDYGSKLDDLSHKYQTNAEALQIEGNLMERATGVADSYVTTLKSIGAVMTAVSKGSTRYDKALRQLGLTTAELKGKTNAEVYDLLLEKLTAITDAAERANAAQTLLGDSGLNLALRAGMSAEEIDKLNSNLVANGIVTSEEAERMAYLGDRIDDIKQKITALIVRIVDGFTSLSPFTQGAILTISAIIILLPKLVAGFGAIKAVIGLITKKTLAQIVANHGLVASLGPILPVILAISAAVLILIKIISIVSKRAKEAAEEQQKMLNKMQSGLPNMEGSIEQSTTTTVESSSSKRIEIDAQVTADGDTPISTDNAVAIGQGIYQAMASDLDQMIGNTIKE